jgi:hypothetical protein
MVAQIKGYQRRAYAIAFLGAVVIGLASRKYPGLFPQVLGKYPGDALWALMVFCGWGFVLNGGSTVKLAAYALATSYADELSQLYQANWINAIRSTTVGHLILGSTFSWFDMLAYTVGVGVGVVGKEALERMWSWNGNAGHL